MIYESPDFITAPRLEHDVCEFYKEVHFSKVAKGVDFEDHLKQLENKWQNIFLAYFDEWNYLLQSRLRDYEFSFWLGYFHKAYVNTLVQVNLLGGFFKPSKSYSAQWLIQCIIKKLQKLFGTTGLHLDINQCNERYEKRIDSIRDLYCSISELSVEAIDIKFYLSYIEGSESVFTISELSKVFKIFERKLKQQHWYNSQVMFTFYHVIRDTKVNRYVIRFYLTIHKTFYELEMTYKPWVSQLWFEATNRLGALLDTFHLGNHETSKYMISDLNNDEIFTMEEPEDPLENLDHLPTVVTSTSKYMDRLCVCPINFQSFHGKKGPCVR